MFTAVVKRSSSQPRQYDGKVQNVPAIVHVDSDIGAVEQTTAIPALLLPAAAVGRMELYSQTRHIASRTCQLLYLLRQRLLGNGHGALLGRKDCCQSTSQETAMNILHETLAPHKVSIVS